MEEWTGRLQRDWRQRLGSSKLFIASTGAIKKQSFELPQSVISKSRGQIQLNQRGGHVKNENFSALRFGL
jgi:hypothetical protein